MSAHAGYLNFDLLIGKEGPEFIARVTQSPNGEALTTFAPPLEGFQAQNLRLRVVRSKGARSIDARSANAARDIGERLFRALFQGDVHTVFVSSRHTAEEQGKRLRIRLRLTDTESAQLPWEYLRDPSSGGRPLGVDRDTPVVRYMELPSQPRKRRVDGPLKILAVISSPTDREELDGDQEWANLKRAVDPLVRTGAVSLERLEPATFAALERALVRDGYHIFHFVGHGGYDEQSGDGVLVFTKDDGTESWISSDQLGPILGDGSTLQLVVLNACEGAVSEGRDIFAGCAQRLVGHGIPAVVAMQAEITDTAAVDFSARFYESLVAGLPVDAALTDGRKAIWAQPNPLEWGTPVLYMRSSDGILFDVAPTVSALQSARPAHLTEIASRTRPPASPRISPWRRYRYPSVAMAGGAVALLAIAVALRVGFASVTPATTPSASVPVQVASSPEQTSAASPSLAGLLGTALLYEATLDAAGTEIGEQFVCSGPACSGVANGAVDPTHGQVRFMDGAIELTARSLDAGGVAAVSFRRTPPARYVAEAVLRVEKTTPGFDAAWRVSLGDLSQHAIVLDANDETVRFQVGTRSASGDSTEDLTPRIPVPGMRAGRAFSLGILVDGSRYVLFLDGAQVDSGTDARLPHEPPGLHFVANAGGEGASGIFAIQALRVYEAPKTLPRSTLLYEATLDAAGSALAERTVCGGPQCLPDPAYGEVTFVEGAVKLTARSRGAGGGSNVTFRRAPPARYVGEAELVLEESTPGFTFSWRVTVGERSEHEIVVDTSQETIRLRYVDGSNAPTSLSFDDLTPSVYVRGMQARRVFSVGVVIDGTSFALFLDGARVAEGTDPRLAAVPAPIHFRASADGPSGSGTMSIRALRLYAVE